MDQWFLAAISLVLALLAFVRNGRLGGVVALAASLVFVVFFLAKILPGMIGLEPAVRTFSYLGHEGLYYSLMMSTGLAFGTICALFGLNHGVIKSPYSPLVATIIGSAVIPTAIASGFYMRRQVLPAKGRESGESAYKQPGGDPES